MDKNTLLIDESKTRRKSNCSTISQAPSYSRFKKHSYNIHELAAINNLEEFIRLYQHDPMLLYSKDSVKGWIPIYFAVSGEAYDIMEFILEHCSTDMLNVQNNEGNTPLHVAIINNCGGSLKFLLDRGADHTIRNKDCHGPIHLCTHLMKADMLQILVSHKSKPDINLEDKLGGVALHYTAFTDDIDSARILINHQDVDHYKMCRNKFMPIHIAAHCGSYRTLQLFIEDASKSKSCKKMQGNLLTSLDGDNNMPLHGAIQFGNFHAAKVCLDNGSSISETDNKYNNTAVHIASLLGSMELLYLFKQKQPGIFTDMLFFKNSSAQTPLHKAAINDNIDVARFLLEQGAFIDEIDNECRSPMLMAATRNNVNMVIFLIQQKCDVTLRDSKLNNLLHLLINNQTNAMFSKNREEVNLELVIEELIKREEVCDLINGQDIEGNTVLHYACKFGFCSYLEVFNKHGADLNIKNNSTQLCLHFAAKYGQTCAVLRCLSIENPQRFINQKDNRGQTALHLAAKNKHDDCVQLLIKRGALFYNCYDGNSPFHAAASSGSVNCITTMQFIEPELLNEQNKDGNTALHLASKNGHKEVIKLLLDFNALLKKNNKGFTFIDFAIKHKRIEAIKTIIAHSRWAEVMDLDSVLYKTPFIGIIQISSELGKMVMDRCIIKKYFNKDPKNMIVYYNFKYLNWTEERVSENGKYIYSPMKPMMKLVEFGCEECLRHDLCKQLLQRKWTKYGFLMHFFQIIFYLIFLIAITMIVVMYPDCVENTFDDAISYEVTNRNVSYKCYNYGSYDADKFEKNGFYLLLGSFCILYAIINIINLLLVAKIGLKKRISEGQYSVKYYTFWAVCQQYTEALLYTLTILFVLPISHFKLFYQLYIIQWHLGAIVIFLSWLNLLLHCQTLYIFGIYVVMFIEILKTIVKVLFLFSILFIGFGLSFYICLNSEFSGLNLTPHLSILRTIIMMQGSDIGGIGYFLVPYTKGEMRYGNISIIFLVIFIFLMPILLTNMLIGLAVGDIDKIQKDAEIKREAKEIENYCDLERKMPRSISKRLVEMDYISFPKSKKSSLFLKNKAQQAKKEKVLLDEKKFDFEEYLELDELIEENEPTYDQKTMMQMILDRLDGKEVITGIPKDMPDYKIGENTY